MFTSEKGKNFMISTFIAFALTLVLGAGIVELNEPDQLRYPVSLEVSADQKFINMTGVIAPSDAEAMRMIEKDERLAREDEPKVFSANMFLASVPLAINPDDNSLFIVINSPGGSASEMDMIVSKIRQLKERGVVVKCLVDGVAASAATIIFSECSERYATDRSVIMWHSVAIFLMTRLNQFEAEVLAAHFKELNETVWAETRSYFDSEYFDVNFKQETLIPAIEVEKESKGKYLTVIDKIEIK